ncbi:MAG TPA: IclR family transcriptional regulator [Solirubrobacteraceae bacterium]|nr:IclR family transcriptional regulator [Solirubrobacteraceae bacterium]
MKADGGGRGKGSEDDEGRSEGFGDEKDRSEEGRDGSGASPAGLAPPFPRLDERRYSRALQGGLAILACFTPERPLLGTTEIAGLVGMSVATASRFVLTLADEGYLERDSSRKYRLTLRAAELGLASISETGLCVHARPHLLELASISGCVAALGVLDGPEALLVDVERPGRGGGRGAEPRARAGRGGRTVEAARSGRGGLGAERERSELTHVPLYCTAIGKVLLAGLPADWRARLIAEIDFERRGPNTILDGESLLGQLSRVARDGLAATDDELCPGACAIAAPVRDESGIAIAAVGLLARAHALELHDLEARFAGPLLKAAGQISARLGWTAAGDLETDPGRKEGDQA